MIWLWMEAYSRCPQLCSLLGQGQMDIYGLKTVVELYPTLRIVAHVTSSWKRIPAEIFVIK